MGYFFFHTKSLKSGVCFILTVQLYLKKWKPVFCDGRKINKTGPPSNPEDGKSTAKLAALAKEVPRMLKVPAVFFVTVYKVLLIYVF